MMYLGNNPVGLITSMPTFANIATIECNNYTPDEDTLVSSVSFNHSLKAIPDFIYIYSDPISKTTTNWEKNYLLQSNSNSYPDSAAVEDYYLFTIMQTKINTTTTASSYGGVEKANFASSSAFKIIVSNALMDNLYFKADATYHYIVGKFKEVTPNA